MDDQSKADDKSKLYLELFKEYRVEIRHQEIQRSTVSGICVALAGGLMALIFKDSPATYDHMKAGLGLILLNFSGIAIVMLRKLYERFALGRVRAQLYLDAIDRAAGFKKKARLGDIWKEGERLVDTHYPYMSFIRLHHLWEALLIGAGAVGVLAFMFYSGVRPLGYNPAIGFRNRWIWIIAGPLFQVLMFSVVVLWEKSKPSNSKRVKSKSFWLVRAICQPFRTIHKFFKTREDSRKRHIDSFIDDLLISKPIEKLEP